MARLRKALVDQPMAPDMTTQPKPARRALREKTNTARGKMTDYENDGNTEDLVKDANPRRGRSHKTRSPENEEDLTMTGGLGIASDKSSSAHPTSDVRTSTTDDLAKSSDAIQPNARMNRRPPRKAQKIVPSAAQKKVTDGMKESMKATARGSRAKHVAGNRIPDAVMPSADATAAIVEPTREPSEPMAEMPQVSRSPSPPPPVGLSVAKDKRSSIAQPGSVLRTHSTPAVESSMLALKNFKRRPRQPSMLQMVQAKLGSARPSLANATTLTVDDNAIDDTSDFDLGLDGDSEAEEDDFAPDAEGTPLHGHKTTRRSTSGSVSRAILIKPTTVGSDGPAKKRKSDQMDVSSGSLSALRAKRQKAAPAAAPEEDVEEEIIIRSSSHRTVTPEPPATSDVQVIASPSSSTPPTEHSSPKSQHDPKDVDDDIVPSTERESGIADAPAQEDEDANATMADPISSSPTVRDTQPRDDDLADPTTQRSPSPAKRRPKAKPKPLDTAALQSMLPKRRKQPLQPRRRKTEYEFDSDPPEVETLETGHLEDDEDELGGRLRAQSKTARKPRATTKKGRPSKTAPTKKTSAAAKGGKEKTVTTYSRGANASDKENGGDESFEEADESTLPEISVSMQELAQSKELEEVKRKFADIDQWDMEFETMSAEDHRSSSQNWR